MRMPSLPWSHAAPLHRLLPLAAAGVVAVAAGCATAPQASVGESVPAAPVPTTTGATAATPFQLSDLNGNRVDLGDYLGRKVILLQFWATWCQPCRQELPALNKVYAEYKDRDFQVLAINVDGPNSVADVKPLARRMGLDFPVLLDPETKVVSTYNPRVSLPFAVLIDKQGRVAFSHEGYDPGYEQLIRGHVASLLGSNDQ